MRDIKKRHLKFAREQAAKWILVDDKFGNAYCTKCQTNYILPKTKHLSKCECPNCHKEMTIQHKWRMRKGLRIIDWTVCAEAIDNHTLVLRYVLASSCGYEDLTIKERARLYIDENKVTPKYCCLSENDEWIEGKQPFFRTPSYMIPNAFFCMYANEYLPGYFNEINKLECFKYYPVEKVYSTKRIASQLLYLINTARISEKLEKVGLHDFIDESYNYYLNNDTIYKHNNRKTELVEMLKLNRSTFKLFKMKPGIRYLKFLQKNPNIDANNYSLMLNNIHICYWEDLFKLANNLNCTYSKIVNYIKKVGIEYAEYVHYVNNLKQLNYDLTDKSYLFPNNFRREDLRVSNELIDKINKENEAKHAKENMLIKQISDGLRKMPELQSFLDGSRGFLVYIPESNADFQKEGTALHNCIGTYTSRVANGNTLLFFIRKLDDPTAPFVAMEYANGQIIQRRYDHNINVTDENVIDFTEALAKTLREQHVLAA